MSRLMARCGTCDTPLYSVPLMMDGVLLGRYSDRCPHCHDGRPATPRVQTPHILPRFYTASLPWRPCAWSLCRRPFQQKVPNQTMCCLACRRGSANQRQRTAKAKARVKATINRRPVPCTSESAGSTSPT